jgi:uncharacterized protein with FMN-binding domain
MRTSTIKSIAALVLTGAGSALVVGFKTTSEATIPGTAAQAGIAGGSAATPSQGATATDGSSTDGSTASGTYADGTWKGAPVSEPWGPFQVEVVVSGGIITDVKLVESPSDRHSSSINNRAVPVLTQSVLASQGTTGDTVSGATWTSHSYASSLQSALAAAARAA